MTKLSDCDLLRHLAARTWSDIQDGAKAGITIGEESITDYLLLELSRRSRHVTYLRKWNHMDEGRSTGADWDWWFLRPDRATGVGLRVQAKRINFFTQRFHELESANRHGRQIEMLESSAATASMHPLYCLYVATEESPSTMRTACGTYALSERPDGWTANPLSLYGCSLLGTQAAQMAIAAHDLRLRPLWPSLLPWSCLACCSALGEDMVERVDKAAQRISTLPPTPPPDREERVSIPKTRRSNHSLITDNLPEEVVALVRGERTDRAVEPPDVGATIVTVDIESRLD